MMSMRRFACGAIALLFLTACGQSDTDTDVPVAGSAPGLFDHVPSDTPYLAGNLEPISAEVLDAYLLRAQPAIDAMQGELTNALEKLSTEDMAVMDETDQMIAKLVRSVLQELDGNLSRKGMQSLGIDLQSQKVLYGMSVFPVMRMGLSDPATLRGTIERVLANAEITSNESEYQGVSYWRLGGDDPQQAPIAFYVALLDDQVALAAFPVMAESEQLPAFLGLEMPAQSDAAERLAKLNRDHGYTPHGSAIFEFDRMLDEFVTPDSMLAKVMADSGKMNAADVPEVCVTEARQIVNTAPRFTVGTSELTSSAIGLQYRLEIKPTMAEELAALVAHIPLADPLSKKMLEFSFGMRLGAMRDFLRTKFSGMIETPYQCEHFQQLNDRAEEAFARLNQPMPPLVNNFRGVRASINELPIDGNVVESAQGLVAVHVEQPQMFVGMAQMFLPDLAELSIMPGDPPIRVPETLLSTPGVVAYAALSDDAIGLSIGEGEEAELPAYLEERAEQDGTFLSTNYDLAGYLSLTDQLSDQMATLNYESEDSEEHSMDDLQDAFQDAFTRSADRNHLEMKLTRDGFTADSRMTFK